MDNLYKSFEPPKVDVGYDDSLTKGGDINSKIARIVGQALRDAKDNGISRAKVAEQLSDALGRGVSEETLNKWCSEASIDHRVPMDAFIALIQQTNMINLVGFVPALFGFAVVDKKYTDVIKLTLVRERRAELEAQEKMLEASVRGVK